MKDINKRSCVKLLLVIFLVIIFKGCTTFSDTKNISVNNIVKEIEVAHDLSSMRKGDSKVLKRYYGLNSNDLEEFCLYLPSSTMDVDEILIVKVKNKKQIESIEDSMEDRANKQLESFKDYAPEQANLIENNEIAVRGNYVIFVISKDAEAIKDKFKEAIK
ncbi:DUF4358 domain-containing protein [Clostridium sardiniense]|uniref:DUF4358 domain-containing protein n=1 Tax=Clostridium sardiniense TaxID=29369 RepID=A0ABS7KZP2_CLOSR|nr:DUF4358 domain-containing protein [Clostridium sardiniense]MBY0756280.1 DUF4358 domain-containing protein [Clostridium sardiniense]MDQ0458776.1 hypothetical protein [Clostridium sardiniense]